MRTHGVPQRFWRGILAGVLLFGILTGCKDDSSMVSDSLVNSTTTALQADASTQKTDDASHAADADSDQTTTVTTAVSQEDASQTQASQVQTNAPQTAAPHQPQSAVTTRATVADSQPDDSESPEESSEVKEIKYIYLKDSLSQYSGSGVQVNGSTVTIFKGGTYMISGTLSNGQLIVAADGKKVRLHLNGVHLTNTEGSAIYVQQAKKVTVCTMSTTTNELCDGGTHDVDNGTIFSEDTIIFEGEGTLNLTANYAHGIKSDDDITVDSGTINITSAKSGLHANDGITINGGTLFCDAGTNGIKTDGYITIAGGRSVFMGGVREEKGAIFCDGVFTYTGGEFYAIGNTCAMPSPTTTTAPVLGLVFASKQPAETLVHAANLFTFTSPRSFKYVVYGGSNLSAASSYAVSYGGTIAGGNTFHGVTTGGTYTGGTGPITFTRSGTVSFFSVT